MKIQKSIGIMIHIMTQKQPILEWFQYYLE